jgi:hypothetical protein
LSVLETARRWFHRTGTGGAAAFYGGSPQGDEKTLSDKRMTAQAIASGYGRGILLIPAFPGESESLRIVAWYSRETFHDIRSGRLLAAEGAQAL